MRRFPVFAVTAMLLATLAPLPARGALTSYDGFDYPDGTDLLGKNGGVGFSAPWTAGGFNASIHSNFDVQDVSLSFGNLFTSGQRVASAPVGAISGLTRNLSAPIGQPGTTRYLSFLIRPEGTLNQGAFNGFFGMVFEQPGEPELFVGKPGGGALDRFVLEDRGGTLQIASPLATVVGETALIVVRADFTAGVDTFTLYTNATPGAPEPASGTIKSNSNIGIAGGLTLYSTGAFSIDEIRLGDTFADVTPVVPEPGAGLLAAASATVLAIRVVSSRQNLMPRQVV